MSILEKFPVEQWQGPVSLFLNNKSFYNGSDTRKAYEHVDIIKGVLQEIKGSGTVIVQDKNGKIVFFEVWLDGHLGVG